MDALAGPNGAGDDRAGETGPDAGSAAADGSGAGWIEAPPGAGGPADGPARVAPSKVAPSAAAPSRDAPPAITAPPALAVPPHTAPAALGVPPEWPAVLAALAEAQARGFVGDGQDLDALADHARGFVGPIAGATRVVDLGSGGGVPGLVIAALCPAATVTLLDASVGRTDWLRRIVGRLGWRERVVVVTGRAEELAHDGSWRGSYDAVVARSFAPPLVTAEVGCALLCVGGRLVVSEPPVPDSTRWPEAALAEIGLRRQSWPDGRYAVLEAVALPPPDVPRARLVRGHSS